ncbi:DUF1428 domain-containing protein [Shewanella sp. A25]|nr:DUF1428 domain-containing protein [Shewanella shenzhenensis]
MSYVDGYVIPVPKHSRDKYLQLAQEAAVVFKEHGALAVVENWGDDVPDGVQTSFPMAVKCEADEVVVFSWIVWPSKELRDVGNKAAIADPRMQNWDPKDMPFDGKRMIFGGFTTILSV